MTKVLSTLRGLGRRPAVLAWVVVALAAVFVLSGMTPFGAGTTHSSPVSSSSHAAPPASAPVAGSVHSGIVAPPSSALPHSTAPPVAEPTHGKVTGQPGTPRSGSLAAPVHPPPLGPSSGKGTFFTSTQFPLPTNATPAYTGGFGTNDTNSPTIAVSTHGDAVVAYTAFTNESPCANASQFAFTEIGVVASTNNGSSWSSPSYLGNPDCTQVYNYTSAWEPSVAVLANGTFVLAYVEYNYSLTGCTGCLPESIYGYYFPFARLVVTFSYDNGSTWTLPTVINATANPTLAFLDPIPELPDVVTTGQTIYLLWDNYTDPEWYYDASAGLQMVVSTDGGATWGSQITFPVQEGIYYSETWYADNAPDAVIGPNGELMVAYTTNYSVTPPFCQQYACTQDYWDSNSIVVATSTNNGSTLHVHTVAPTVVWQEDDPGFAFVDDAPQILYDAANGNTYVSYIGVVFSNGCFTFPGSPYCYIGPSAPWISVSSNLGVTWSRSSLVAYALNSPLGGVYNENYNVALGLNSTGALFVADQFTNDSICQPTIYGLSCGVTYEVEMISTNGGVSFTGPYQVDSFGTQDGLYWQGLTAEFATLNNNLTLAWANPTCPGWVLSGGCYWISPGGFVNITLSQVFEGAGVTVTFNETGLPAGTPWSASLTGNERSALAGTNLTVSGVPNGANQSWVVPWVNTTYGNALGSNVTPSSPGTIAGNATINASFEPYVLLNVGTVPPPQSGEPFSCNPSLFFQEFCANQAINPRVGGDWVPLGAVLIYNVTYVGFDPDCFYCYNLSFLSWTGSGAGSWNSTNPNGSSTITGPVNETASFNFLNECSGYMTYVCTNATYDYFFTETGLPTNTTWQVTLANQTASGNTSVSPVIAFSAGQGPYNFTVWNVPFNATWSYVGSPSFASPITALQGGTELVTFSLVPDSSLVSDVTFGVSGLPYGVSSWGLSLDGTSYGIPAAGSTFLLATGNYTLNASAVYGSNGVGAYLGDFLVQPLTLNEASFTVLPGGIADLSGPAVITAVFAPEYYVSVSASSGGSVAPDPVGWTHGGAAVQLTATAAAHNNFVGWTGTGAGAVTGTSLVITVTPNGPVTELATFVGVTPTYHLQVSATGIVSGLPVTLSLGTQTYTEPAPFSVSGLLAGSYTISVPTIYPNGTTGVRYDPTGVSSSLTLAGGSLDVTANGTVSITYAASFALTLTPSVNGTTTPGPGTFWESGASPVTLTATPLAGHSFAAWIGMGLGSYSGNQSNPSITLSGGVTETATFSTNPYVPPATYNLTVTETGLPTGVTWSASIGAEGTSGPAGSGASSLLLSDLNGSYQLSVPTISGAAGVQYFPTYTATVAVTSVGATASVTFVTQYEVTVTSSAGGTATTSVLWAPAGSVVTLTASANSSSTFENWTGTGSGSYTGTSASTTITVSGPVSELATFVPSSSLVKTSSSSGGGSWALPIAILVVLLIVGLVVGLLIARSRPPSGGAGPGPEEPEADTSTVPVWTESAETPSPAPSAPTGGTEDESIYGGGPG